MPSDMSTELTKIETAARFMMAQNVNPTQRREAEVYFVQLKSSTIDLATCQTILENTKEPFVVFQLAQCFASSLVRNYNSYSDELIQQACKYLLEFAINKPDLPAYAISELFKASVLIYKHGTRCSSDILLTTINDLLNSASDTYQSLGLRIIETLCIEHSTFWRNLVMTSYQQYQAAKQRFEEQFLRKFLELAVSRLSSQNLSQTECERFLRIAQLVLQWNFKSTMVTSQIVVPLYTFDQEIILRPPLSWADIFSDEQFLPFFFRIHQAVRGDSQLSEHSMACIVQLGGLMGSVLVPSGKRIKISTSNILYIQRYLALIMETFQECHLHELSHFINALHQIFFNHSNALFRVMPDAFLSKLIKFIVFWILKLIGPTVNLSDDEDELGLIQSLFNLFYAWNVFTRLISGYLRSIQPLIKEQNVLVVNCFIQTVLLPPFGQRTVAISNTFEESDRGQSIIKDLGFYCRLHIYDSLKTINSSLMERISQRQLVAEVSADQRKLWLEDIRWALLLIDVILKNSDYNIGTMLNEAYSQGAYRATDMNSFFLQCIQQSESFNPPVNADPVVISCGLVAHLSGILLKVFGSSNVILDEAVIRQTIQTLATVIRFLTDMHDLKGYDQSYVLPFISVEGESSAMLIQFVIQLCFSVFREYSSNKLVCTSAVELLNQESEKRAKIVIQTNLLYEKLGSITLEGLSCRRELIDCIVSIPYHIDSDTGYVCLRDTMFVALASRFMEVSRAFQARQLGMDVLLISLFECFGGIARGARLETGNDFYAYLIPIMQECAQLIHYADLNQSVMKTILGFYKDVVNKLLVYVDRIEKSETNVFNILGIFFEAYLSTHLKRYHEPAQISAISDEDEIFDLISVLDIVRCALVTDQLFLIGDDYKISLCFKMFESFLPLLNSDVLHLPDLSHAYFGFLSKSAEFSIESIYALESSLFEKLLFLLCEAVHGSFGLQQTKLAFDTIHKICQESKKLRGIKDGPFALAVSRMLIQSLFEVAFHSYESDPEFQTNVARSLFSLYHFNQKIFNEFVSNLFSRLENAANYDQLVNEYNLLMTPSEDTRKGFMEWNKRFENFICNIQKILVV